MSDVSLISVLRDEMKVERDFYRRDESLLDGPPNGFEIDDTPGKNSFFLLKVCQFIVLGLMAVASQCA